MSFDLPPKVAVAIIECAKNWGAPTVARRHLEEIARLAITEELAIVVEKLRQEYLHEKLPNYADEAYDEAIAHCIGVITGVPEKVGDGN